MMRKSQSYPNYDGSKNKFVIWGLRSVRHSHRYIHSGFFDAARYLGFESIWVDDSEKNREVVDNKSVVLSVNIASEHLPVVSGAKYILHNHAPKNIVENEKYLSLQVYSSEAIGKNLDLAYVYWDEMQRTLYQPWGVPIRPQEWLPPSQKKKMKEYWIGAVWNNQLNQGNLESISEYKKLLSEHGIAFIRKGGTRSIRKNGLSDEKMLRYVNASPIGSAIVGEWQAMKQYVPCRLFKNIAGGQIPTSNSDFSALFGGTGIFNPNMKILVDSVLALSHREKRERVTQAQEIIKQYSYENNLRRIYELLG